MVLHFTFAFVYLHPVFIMHEYLNISDGCPLQECPQIPLPGRRGTRCPGVLAWECCWIFGENLHVSKGNTFLPQNCSNSSCNWAVPVWMQPTKIVVLFADLFRDGGFVSVVKLSVQLSLADFYYYFCTRHIYHQIISPCSWMWNLFLFLTRTFIYWNFKSSWNTRSEEIICTYES